MERLKTLEQFEKLRQSKTIFVFSSDMCIDCHKLKKDLPSLISNNKNYKFVYVDRNEMIELYKDLKIVGVPAFVIYIDGEKWHDTQIGCKRVCSKYKIL